MEGGRVLACDGVAVNELPDLIPALGNLGSLQKRGRKCTAGYGKVSGLLACWGAKNSKRGREMSDRDQRFDCVSFSEVEVKIREQGELKRTDEGKV